MEEEETGEESLNYTEDSSVVMLDFTHESSAGFHAGVIRDYARF